MKMLEFAAYMTFFVHFGKVYTPDYALNYIDNIAENYSNMALYGGV